MISDREFLRNVGAELRAIRKKAGFTLEQVADSMGRKRNNLSQIERGEQNMSLRGYLKLMNFYRDFARDHPSLALSAHLERDDVRGSSAVSGDETLTNSHWQTEVSDSHS
jgi:transcriptional regulator with XRE-family HTH domain